MKATKHILAIAGFLLAVGFSKGQTTQTDSTVVTPPATITDTTTAVHKAPLYDTGQNNAYCPTCNNTDFGVNHDHVTPYYRENKPYADPVRTANMKPGILSTDGARPSINGARSSGTAYYYNGIRLLENSPVSRIPGQAF